MPSCVSFQAGFRLKAQRVFVPQFALLRILDGMAFTAAGQRRFYELPNSPGNSGYLKTVARMVQNPPGKAGVRAFEC